MAYSADFTLSSNAAFQNQVQMSATKAAINIKAEARTIHPTLDAKRQAFADRVLSSETGLVQKLVFACIETGLSGTPTDAQVDVAVSSVWNAMAAVTPGDQA